MNAAVHLLDWLEGKPAQAQHPLGEDGDGVACAYSFYEKELRPRGFTLSASIINFLGGKPGDVGVFFLRW
jgi:hypothetical protein